MIGERIHRARKAAGLSLRDLAGRVGVSHTTLRELERDERPPSSKQLVAIGEALGVRVESLLRPIRVRLEGLAYRKRKGLKAKVRDRIHAEVLDQLERWQELLTFVPPEAVPPFELPETVPTHIELPEEVEEAAEGVRAAWGLGTDPISDLIDALEARGVIVVETQVADEGRFDGLSAIADGATERPVIVVHSNWPGDRQRLTLAHELGHLVLECRLGVSIDLEAACQRFAGAFLMPKSSLQAALGATRRWIEPRELAMLKEAYGVSMQACVVRAAQIGVIGDATKSRLFRLFSARGWRRCEPGPGVPAETTHRFPQLVYRALAEDLIGEPKAAELLGMPVAEVHRLRRMEGTDAAPAGQ